MAAHKHAEVIKAWADGGAIIEVRCIPSDGWRITPNPHWHPAYEYRVQPISHKWQAVIDAYAAKKLVQWNFKVTPPGVSLRGWQDLYGFDHPVAMFNYEDYEWRIKPVPTERYMTVGDSLAAVFKMHMANEPVGQHKMNLKLTFEDEKLIKAEVV